MFKMLRCIDSKDYNIFENEFQENYIQKYCNLHIYPEIGNLERICGLLTDLCEDLKLDHMVCINSTHGGFIPINCSNSFTNIGIVQEPHTEKHIQNINTNINRHKISNVIFQDEVKYSENLLVFVQNKSTIDLSRLEECKPVIITEEKIQFNSYKIFSLSNSEYNIYIPESRYQDFYANFRYYLTDDNYVIEYDNLINLCIMVKNGGEQFESMLQDNINYIDRWTILDTGSTDNTINIANKVLANKKGKLYTEPFINFRDSRNRLLDLAGKTCKYTLMLDDTYVIQGNIRKILGDIRGDQYANSYSFYIQSDDSLYASNRLVKSLTGLRYINTIHEIITQENNICCVIPQDDVFILDRRFDYMEKRTRNRKMLDLELLEKEVEKNPNEPRSYYYIAQTYRCLEDHENAYKYFIKRSQFRDNGFRQELVDAIFEAARTANFILNKPWEECLKLYLDAYNVDNRRPESLYFIGVHYYTENDYKEAFKYWKKAFELGFPIDCQYSLKPTLCYHFLPKLLAKICYHIGEYIVGQKACELFLAHNYEHSDGYHEVVSWNNIYLLLNSYKGDRIPVVPKKPIFCYVAQGGFSKWSGKNIYTTGLGGSETHAVELCRQIHLYGYFDTYIFCDCEEEETVDGVKYRKISNYPEFINKNYVHTIIVSRYLEYLPLTIKGWSENIYVFLHDLLTPSTIIPVDNKVKKIFCLTEWHRDYVWEFFPTLKEKITYHYYGINKELFNKKEKIRNSFIYSSTANRGLLQLLEMWPKIYSRYPDATLQIFCDLENKWVNTFYREKIIYIKCLLEKYKDMGISHRGWVNKRTLYDTWEKSQYWFYPCTFTETFCMTALEAAISGTLAITNGKGSLENTVGDRGFTIPGDPQDPSWQEKALYVLFDIIDNTRGSDLVERNYEWAKKLTWSSQAENFLEKYILPNNLEYKNMFNWTNDVPSGTKNIFMDVIKYFNTKKITSPKILEIGTYTGISLVNIVSLIPGSIGTGVDSWKNYPEIGYIEELEIEKSFYRHVNMFGLTNRIFGIKSDSTEYLLKACQNQELFHFIYIDGNHTLLDSYSDMILSWNILQIGGIIGIDDYLFNYNKNSYDNILDRPFESVNKFLEKYRGKYNLLHSGYRVFLEKIAE